MWSSVIAHYDYTKLYYSQFFWVDVGVGEIGG